MAARLEWMNVWCRLTETQWERLASRLTRDRGKLVGLSLYGDSCDDVPGDILAEVVAAVKGVVVLCRLTEEQMTAIDQRLARGEYNIQALKLRGNNKGEYGHLRNLKNIIKNL